MMRCPVTYHPHPQVLHWERLGQAAGPFVQLVSELKAANAGTSSAQAQQQEVAADFARLFPV